MSQSLNEIPEIQGLESRRDLIRIPPEMDIPITPRVRRVVDTAAFRRLASISQLGLVSLVYPAAHHRRFEHSLGVYRLCLAWIAQLSRDDRFAEIISVPDAEQLILASLLHDVAHWPFCHIIEDMSLPGVPAHETLARDYLVRGELADVIRQEWQCDPAAIADLLVGRADTAARRL
ncbi:MAG: HD domain-containing protein, partial [Planctomycetales bacterium]|nr:HD domain-containing protein [Planctomycetales bacterium]